MKKLRKLAAILCWGLIPLSAMVAGFGLGNLMFGVAFGQSSPGLIYGQVPTAGQWNSYFQAKQDVLGFTPVQPATVGLQAFRVRAVNFNVANTDTTITITIPSGTTRYAINTVRVSNASAAISLATLGVFTGAGGTGQTIVANAAVTVSATATDTNGNLFSATIANQATEAYSDTVLYIRIGTAQGTAVTADVIVTIIPLS